MLQKDNDKDNIKKATAKTKAKLKTKAKKKKILGSASAVRRGYLTPVDKKHPVSTKALVKSDPLQSYLAEINRYRLLTREEEKDLGTKIQADDENAADAAYIMVTSNLRLVVKIALDFQRIWMQNLLDLIQEGNIGLVRAVKNLIRKKM